MRGVRRGVRATLLSKSEWFGDVFEEGEAVLVGDFVEGLGVADGEHDVALDDEAESEGESGVGVLRVAFEGGFSWGWNYCYSGNSLNGRDNTAAAGGMASVHVSGFGRNGQSFRCGDR